MARSAEGEGDPVGTQPTLRLVTRIETAVNRRTLTFGAYVPSRRSASRLNTAPRERLVGHGPPAIQSSSSIVCTTGSAAPRKLGHAADIARRDQVGLRRPQIVQLSRAQSFRDRRLQQIISAGRATAEMRLSAVPPP